MIAPILAGLGVVELDALRVAAIANNAPVSYGALGAPILALAAVTGVPLLTLSLRWAGSWQSSPCFPRGSSSCW